MVSLSASEPRLEGSLTAHDSTVDELEIPSTTALVERNINMILIASDSVSQAPLPSTRRVPETLDQFLEQFNIFEPTLDNISDSMDHY